MKVQARVEKEIIHVNNDRYLIKKETKQPKSD